MTHDELIAEKAIFELYGASMVSPGVIAHLFDFAIGSVESAGVVEDTGDAQAPAKVKRTTKKAD